MDPWRIGTAVTSRRPGSDPTPVLVNGKGDVHRVDIRRTSRPVSVATSDGIQIARSDRATMVFETGAPPRAYLPREDVTVALVPSSKRSVCPYKGQASYFSVRAGDRLIEDAAWSYERPLPEAGAAAGLISFLHEDLTTALGKS
jgi:uncharacterized protein (DUF427 family)